MDFHTLVDNRPHVGFAARRDDNDVRLAIGGNVEDGTAQEALVAAIGQSHPGGPSPDAAPLRKHYACRKSSGAKRPRGPDPFEPAQGFFRGEARIRLDLRRHRASRTCDLPPASTKLPSPEPGVGSDSVPRANRVGTLSRRTEREDRTGAQPIRNVARRTYMLTSLPGLNRSANSAVSNASGSKVPPTHSSIDSCSECSGSRIASTKSA